MTEAKTPEEKEEAESAPEAEQAEERQESDQEAASSPSGESPVSPSESEDSSFSAPSEGSSSGEGSDEAPSGEAKEDGHHESLKTDYSWNGGKIPTMNSLRKPFLNRTNSFYQANQSYRAFVNFIAGQKSNYIFRKTREEEIVFDKSWVEQLRQGCDAVERIIANPRTFIQDNRIVVEAALAKKVSAESVAHLASHSQFVRGVDKEGNIIPEKILTVTAEEDIQTYENRFVMTLIEKLARFVQMRVDYVTKAGEARNSDVLLLHSKFFANGVTYEVDNRVKASIPLPPGKVVEITGFKQELITLGRRVHYFQNSPFMKQMNGARPVHNPIVNTNILAKDKDYHAALLLWRFIDGYTSLGVNYQAKELSLGMQKEDNPLLYTLVANDILALRGAERDELSLPAADPELKIKKFNPRVKLNLDDETFNDSQYQYSQFPDLKEAFDQRFADFHPRPQDELPLSPTVAESAAKAANDREEQREEIIYAADIHSSITRERIRYAKDEDNRDMLERRRLSELLAEEGKRLDDIEAKIQEEIRQEEAEKKELWAKEAERYEKALLAKERAAVEEEAKLDKIREQMLRESRERIRQKGQFDEAMANQEARNEEAMARAALLRAEARQAKAQARLDEAIAAKMEAENRIREAEAEKKEAEAAQERIAAKLAAEKARREGPILVENTEVSSSAKGEEAPTQKSIDYQAYIARIIQAAIGAVKSASGALVDLERAQVKQETVKKEDAPKRAEEQR